MKLYESLEKQLKKGWRITSRTERDPFTVVILFLFFIIPGIFYLLFTQGRTQSIYIEVNAEGEIRYSNKDFSRVQLEQANYHANN